jgi:hypothetical protein
VGHSQTHGWVWRGQPWVWLDPRRGSGETHGHGSGQTHDVGLARPKAGSDDKGAGFLSSFITLISCFCSHFSFLQFSSNGDVSNGDWRLQNNLFTYGLDLRGSHTIYITLDYKLFFFFFFLTCPRKGKRRGGSNL